MEFFGSPVQKITVKVLKIFNNEVWISIDPFIGKKSVYNKLLWELRRKIPFNTYKTFERIETLPVITKSGALKTLYLLEKGRKPILVIPENVTEEDISGKINSEGIEQIKKIPVEDFEILSFYRVIRYDLILPAEEMI